MEGETVCEVTRSRHPGFKPGDIVRARERRPEIKWLSSHMCVRRMPSMRHGFGIRRLRLRRQRQRRALLNRT
ncbi:hypothetical protein [Rhizobium sp. 2YAF20]|uniref:hypothetical protein n=1 Tax=Rhizobium sp. 2YAF20 TaxID=3233027 RepID=UPI003F9B8D2D